MKNRVLRRLPAVSRRRRDRPCRRAHAHSTLSKFMSDAELDRAGAGRAFISADSKFATTSERKKLELRRCWRVAARGRRPGKAGPAHSKPPPNPPTGSSARRTRAAWLRGGQCVSSPDRATTRELTRTGDATGCSRSSAMIGGVSRRQYAWLAVDLGSGLVSLLRRSKLSPTPTSPRKKKCSQTGGATFRHRETPRGAPPGAPRHDRELAAAPPARRDRSTSQGQELRTVSLSPRQDASSSASSPRPPWAA